MRGGEGGKEKPWKFREQQEFCRAQALKPVPNPRGGRSDLGADVPRGKGDFGASGNENDAPHIGVLRHHFTALVIDKGSF